MIKLEGIGKRIALDQLTNEDYDILMRVAIAATEWLSSEREMYPKFNGLINKDQWQATKRAIDAKVALMEAAAPLLKEE